MLQISSGGTWEEAVVTVTAIALKDSSTFIGVLQVGSPSKKEEIFKKWKVGGRNAT